MKLGIITDIHEHVEDLERALAQCDRHGVDRVICLGDVFQTGEAIRETVALLARRNIPGVWGNHDFGLCSHPSARASSRRVHYAGPVLDYLATFQPCLEVEDCLFSHVEPWRDLNDVMGLWYLGGLPDLPEKAARSFDARPQRVLFTGHHHRWLVATPEGVIPWDGGGPIRLEAPRRYLVVVAAVCEGFCAVYDTTTGELLPVALREGRSEGPASPGRHRHPTSTTREVRMAHAAPGPAPLDEWIAREAILFSPDAPTSLHAAIDRVVAALGDGVELLGFGEALHGGEEILVLRNRLFERLVAAHGYSAIAVESSFPRSLAANEYVNGRGTASALEVYESGFSHGMGRLEANRDLLEWMRRCNADPSRRVELRFYGFDIPGLTGGLASPRQVLTFVLDYLSEIDGPDSRERRQRIEALLGMDAPWENQAALVDPAQAVGLSPGAAALRIETEDLVAELRTRRPELVARSGRDGYAEALQHALAARELLNFHAGVARNAGYAALLGLRDAAMADNLAYLAERERGRGKVLVFAHNAHLQRGQVTLPLGAVVCTWWSAGAHLHEQFGARYAVIGSAVGVSEANGIGLPEPGTLEAHLTAAPGPARFLPTHRGEGLPPAQVAALPARSGSRLNPTYVGLSPQSLTDFDWLVALDSTTYNRGGPPLRQPGVGPGQ